MIPENKKETDEGVSAGSWERAPFLLAGARSIPSLLALSARRLQAQCVLLLYVVYVCVVNMRWRSQGWCDGEEQSVPAHPCLPPPPTLLLANVEKLSQSLSAWLTLNDLITCFRLEQL